MKIDQNKIKILIFFILYLLNNFVFLSQERKKLNGSLVLIKKLMIPGFNNILPI